MKASDVLTKINTPEELKLESITGPCKWQMGNEKDKDKEDDTCVNMLKQR